MKNIEQALELARLAKEKSITLPKATNGEYTHKYSNCCLAETTEWRDHNNLEYGYTCNKCKKSCSPAPMPIYTTDELLKWLPEYLETPVDKEKCDMYMVRQHNKFKFGYYNFNLKNKSADTPQKALYLLIIELIKKNIIK